MIKNAVTLVLAILLALSVSANIWMTYKTANTNELLAKQERISYQVTSNYYGFLQFVKDNNQKLVAKSQQGGFFQRLFGSDSDMLDLSEWEDPMKGID